MSSTSQSAKKWRLEALEEQRQSEILNAEQLAKKCETNPSLRQELQLETQQKVEARRDFGLQEMLFHELQSSLSGHKKKRSWTWYKEAKLELQRLRETERANGEHLGQKIDISALLRRNVHSQPISTDASCASPSSDSWGYIADILPITTPAAFALRYPQSEPRLWFQSKNASIPVQPPGRRFSVCEMPQIPREPKPYNWLQKVLGLNL